MTFTGDQDFAGTTYRLFRLYASTDRDCVNVVFRSSVVGGPAFAPRVSGPLALPANQDELDAALFGILPSAKTEGAKTYMSDGTPLSRTRRFARTEGCCGSTFPTSMRPRPATSGPSFRSGSV